jgi:undecaprenyl diphosphate synthase
MPTHVQNSEALHGLHVAIIMDGSGRWAESRGLTRMDGHRAGAAPVRRIVDAAPLLGVATLTLFAFSSDNWKRPRSEVDALMEILTRFLIDFHPDAARTGVCIDVIGRRDRLAPPLRDAIEKAEAATRAGRSLHLRLAVDYSGREAIVRAVQQVAAQGTAERAPREVAAREVSAQEVAAREVVAQEVPAREIATRNAFREALANVVHACRTAPEVDLLIRTGGEQRLSDFLLWECAYAELYFTPCKWPEFSVTDLREAIQDFRARERRFGSVPSSSHV